MMMDKEDIHEALSAIFTHPYQHQAPRLKHDSLSVEFDLFNNTVSPTTAVQSEGLFIGDIFTSQFDEDIMFGINMDDSDDSAFCNGDSSEENSISADKFTSNELVSSGSSLSPGKQIRNHDCMWSGRCQLKDCLNNNKNSKMILSQRSNNSVNINKNNSNNRLQAVSPAKIQPPLTIIQQSQSSNRIVIKSKPKSTYHSQDTYREDIQAGQSLLKNRTIQSKRNHNLACSTDSFLGERDTRSRPDTPISFDDRNSVEFKHNIDLVACTMGSNNQHLQSSADLNRINQVKQDIMALESTPSKYPYLQQLDESKADKIDIESILDDFFDEGMNDDTSVSSTSSTRNNSPTSDIYKTTEASWSSTQSGMHSDHSYTRCSTNTAVDTTQLGVQTPSDSENTDDDEEEEEEEEEFEEEEDDEEIDVVSVQDKIFPTNPTAKQRKTIQNKVNNRLASGHQTNQLHYGKVPNRKLAEQQQRFSSVNQIQNAPVIVIKKENSSNRRSYSNGQKNSKSENSRKRPLQMKDDNPRAAKKARVSSAQSSPAHSMSGGRKPRSSKDELSVAEKRSLHNDMERQRRIGLKNLFDELRAELPAFKEKDRAPKVYILREAEVTTQKYRRQIRERVHYKRQITQLQKYLRSLYNDVAMNTNCNVPQLQLGKIHDPKDDDDFQWYDKLNQCSS